MATKQGNRAGRSSVYEYRSASLATDFGDRMIRMKFEKDADEILERLGKFSRGPRKGLQRGYIHWRKVEEGGFNYTNRMVEYRGCYDWCVRVNSDRESEDISAIVANK